MKRMTVAEALKILDESIDDDELALDKQDMRILKMCRLAASEAEDGRVCGLVWFPCEGDRVKWMAVADGVMRVNKDGDATLTFTAPTPIRSRGTNDPIPAIPRHRA